MTIKENDFNRKLLSDLRKDPVLAGAWVCKHNDFYTAGIPDFHITSGPLSTWFEVKVEPNRMTPLQYATIRKCMPRAYLLIVARDGSRVTLSKVTDNIINPIIAHGTRKEIIEHIIRVSIL